jgi:hypothetical protein
MLVTYNTFAFLSSAALPTISIRLICTVIYSEFETRWKQSGGAERANYGMFIDDLSDLIGISRPDPTTDNPAQDAYVLERAVTFQDCLVRLVFYPPYWRLLLARRRSRRMDEKTRKMDAFINIHSN